MPASGRPTGDRAPRAMLGEVLDNEALRAAFLLTAAGLGALSCVAVILLTRAAPGASPQPGDGAPMHLSPTLSAETLRAVFRTSLSVGLEGLRTGEMRRMVLAESGRRMMAVVEAQELPPGRAGEAEAQRAFIAAQLRAVIDELEGEIEDD